jgi:hypothetical protein
MLKKAFAEKSALGESDSIVVNPQHAGSHLLHLRSQTSIELRISSTAKDIARHQSQDQVGSLGSFDEPSFGYGSPPIEVFKSEAVEEPRALPVRQPDDSISAPDELFQFEDETEISTRTRGGQATGSRDPSKEGPFKAVNSAPDIISQTLQNSLKMSHSRCHTHTSSKNLSECNSYFGSQVSRPSLPLAITARQGPSKDVEGGSPSNFLPPHELIAASFKGSPVSRALNLFAGSALAHNSTNGSRHRSVADRIKHTLFEQQTGKGYLS